MIDYIATLPMWVQLFIIFGGLIMIGVTTSAVLYRLVKYGIRVKIGPAEIDATEENAPEKKP